LSAIDWHDLFGFSVSPLELIVRGTSMYWFLFLVFRTVMRRNVGSIGIADVLVLVIIADAAQNAMAGEYKSITDGMLLVSTIVGWNYLLDWLSYRFPALRRWLEPSPLLLVRNGKLLHRNLRKEFLSEEELRTQLREHGVEHLDEVKQAYMEADGAVSVITKDKSTR
jgi:uncharacterized membrane protein YcaP (DUF421 family)